MPSPMLGGFLPRYSGISGYLSCTSGSDRSGTSGRFSIEPSALVTRFWKAAAGLKNMCANLDQNTVPNSTVAAAMNRANKRIPPNPDQSSANVVVASSARMNRSAFTTRYQGLPSAATSTRMKNQNQ